MDEQRERGVRYETETVFTEEAVRGLFRAQFLLFEKLRIWSRVAMGAVLTAFGFSPVFGTPQRVLCRYLAAAWLEYRRKGTGGRRLKTARRCRGACHLPLFGGRNSDRGQRILEIRGASAPRKGRTAFLPVPQPADRGRRRHGSAATGGCGRVCGVDRAEKR